MTTNNLPRGSSDSMKKATTNITSLAPNSNDIDDVMNNIASKIKNIPKLVQEFDKHKNAIRSALCNNITGNPFTVNKQQLKKEIDEINAISPRLSIHIIYAAITKENEYSPPPDTHSFLKKIKELCNKVKDNLKSLFSSNTRITTQTQSLIPKSSASATSTSATITSITPPPKPPHTEQFNAMYRTTVTFPSRQHQNHDAQENMEEPQSSKPPTEAIYKTTVTLPPQQKYTITTYNQPTPPSQTSSPENNSPSQPSTIKKIINFYEGINTNGDIDKNEMPSIPPNVKLPSEECSDKMELTPPPKRSSGAPSERTL